MTEENIKHLTEVTSKLTHITNRQFFLNTNINGVIELCVMKSDRTPIVIYKSRFYSKMLSTLHIVTKFLFIVRTDSRTPLNNQDIAMLKELDLGEDTDWRIV